MEDLDREDNAASHSLSLRDADLLTPQHKADQTGWQAYNTTPISRDLGGKKILRFPHTSNTLKSAKPIAEMFQAFSQRGSRTDPRFFPAAGANAPTSIGIPIVSPRSNTGFEPPKIVEREGGRFIEEMTAPLERLVYRQKGPGMHGLDQSQQEVQEREPWSASHGHAISEDRSGVPSDFEDLRSYPLENIIDLRLNRNALARMRRYRAHEVVGQHGERRKGLLLWLARMWDVLAYVCAGLIMYPHMPSERHGADGCGFNGSDEASGRLSYWEVGVSGLAIVDITDTLVTGINHAEQRLIVGSEWAAVGVVRSDGIVAKVMLGIFCADACLKIVAYKGVQAYMRSSLNVMDLVCTLLVMSGELSWRQPSFAGLRVLRIIGVLVLSKRTSNMHRVSGSALSQSEGYSLGAILWALDQSNAFAILQICL